MQTDVDDTSGTHYHYNLQTLPVSRRRVNSMIKANSFRFELKVICTILIVATLSLFSACRCLPGNRKSCNSNSKPIGIAKQEPVSDAIKIIQLPVQNLSLFPDAETRMDTALFNALSASRQFDVCRDPEFNTCDPAHLADTIARLKWKAAAVVLATVEEYQPYPRPTLTVRVEMYRTKDAIRVATLTGHFDSSDKQTSDAIRQSYFSLSDSRHPGSSDIVFDSPDVYFRYASEQMTNKLVATLSPHTTAAMTAAANR